MAAIVRVKRKISEDPADSIVFSCKRKKCDKANEGHLKPIFKFAKTVSIKEDHVAAHIRGAIKQEKLAREYKRNGATSSIPQRMRQSSKSASSKQRYSIVTEKRGIDLESLDKEDSQDVKKLSDEDEEEDGVTDSGRQAGDSKIFCLYDVVNEDLMRSKSVVPDTAPITCNGVAMVREKAKPPAEDPNAYVYDLYYMNNQDFDFRALESILAVEARCGPQEFLDDRDDGDEDCYEDEDDSNDEGNWRNDYPDEDPGYYDERLSGDDYDGGLDSDDDFRGRFTGMSLGDRGARNLGDSSDDEHADGDAYARYKSRIKREMGGKT